MGRLPRSIREARGLPRLTFVKWHKDHLPHAHIKKLGKVDTDFVQPYPQDALGGELGLTSEDIARSLGIRNFDVIKKIERMDLEKLK